MSKVLRVLFCVLFVLLLAAGPGCVRSAAGPVQAPPLPETVKTVPHESAWGIYRLDREPQEVSLVYASDAEIFGSSLKLNSAGDTLLFARKTGTDENSLEIYTVKTDGGGLTQLTDNDYFDLYPVWSPDDSKIAFLSRRGGDLDIYMMDADGGNQQLFYDSGDNDADIDWAGDTLVFTSGFAIWSIGADGGEPVRITDPPGRGEWGEANLPKGDYDPRLNSDGTKVVFERLENTDDPNGGYDLFTVRLDGLYETRLTATGYSQGLAEWSDSGDEIVYIVAAIDGQGRYDLYLVNSDGSDNRDITPSYFPDEFICRAATFSRDGSAIYFIGQWWE